MKNLLKAIEANRFEEAEKLSNKHMLEQVVNMLEERAFRTGDIAYYCFSEYLAKKNNDAYLYYTTSCLLLDYYIDTLVLENAIDLAFNYAQKAVENEPNNLNYKEHLIQFCQYPKNNPKLEKQSSITICKSILDRKPNDQYTKEIYDYLLNS